MFKIFALILCIVTLSTQVLSCSVTDEQLEGYFLDMMFFGNPNAIVPANDGDMAQHCDMMHRGIDGIKLYGETCTQGFIQEIIKIFLKSFKDHMFKRCDNPKDRSEFIQYVGCLIPRDQKMAPMMVCTEKFIKMFELSVEMGEKGHILGACCSHYMFRHCILDEVNKVCGEGHKQYWDEIFDDVVTDVSNFACEGLTSVDKCAKGFNPEYYKQLETVFLATDPAVWRHGHKTPMRFIIDMVARYHKGR